jgi:hypothetical protein
MSATGPEHASTPGPQTPKLSQCSGPQGIRGEIQRLAAAGLYAIPVHLRWNAKKGLKVPRFPRKYKHIETPESWRKSLNSAMKDRKDANGVAILTGPSRLFTIDVDVAKITRNLESSCGTNLSTNMASLKPSKHERGLAWRASFLFQSDNTWLEVHSEVCNYQGGR